MLSKPKKRGSERPDKVKMSNSPRVLDKAERKNSMPLPMVRETSKGEMRVPGSARAHSSSELPQPVAYRGASSPALIAKPSESEETQGKNLKQCLFLLNNLIRGVEGVHTCGAYYTRHDSRARSSDALRSPSHIPLHLLSRGVFKCSIGTL